jgi:hypothetical protein
VAGEQGRLGGRAVSAVDGPRERVVVGGRHHVKRRRGSTAMAKGRGAVADGVLREGA